MIRHLPIVCAVVVLLVSPPATRAQQTWPAFTVVERTTYYDIRGEVVSVSTSTRYNSASGNWRSVGNVGGYELATVSLRGKGIYHSSSRIGLLLKDSDHAPGCALTTAEELLGDSKFKRAEIVLGFKTYVLSERFSSVGYTVETYFVPELGRIPFKRTYIFDNGQKWITEPISIKFGEPAAADLYGPDYSVIEQIPIFNNQLAKQILSKPNPIYPPAAQERSVSGTVIVSVVVDESGRVVSALVTTPIPMLNEAAIDAAYQAWFLPTIREGKPVVTSGILAYNFALPRPEKD
ncbi:MAG TPA: energy transducer TonB [Pyrinomonadaceae bacterium]|nr:energy transducer TonB [Pyrinomonadaceae bacterium]